jgi:hypothetical protein
MDMGITITRNLLTRSWTADVGALEMRIRRLALRRPVTNDCCVALFEIPGDRDLHVNVTHRCRTKAAEGWSGPGVLPQGFVHNRTFDDPSPSAIGRHIREMIFASDASVAGPSVLRRSASARSRATARRG